MEWASRRVLRITVVKSHWVGRVELKPNTQHKPTNYGTGHAHATSEGERERERFAATLATARLARRSELPPPTQQQYWTKNTLAGGLPTAAVERAHKPAQDAAGNASSSMRLQRTPPTSISANGITYQQAWAPTTRRVARTQPGLQTSSGFAQVIRDDERLQVNHACGQQEGHLDGQGE